MMILQTIIVLVASLLAVMFTLQNPHHVQKRFMAWQTAEFPLIALIIISLLAGVIVAAILSLKTSWQLNRKIRELQAELGEAKKSAVEKEPAEADGQRSYEEEEENPQRAVCAIHNLRRLIYDEEERGAGGDIIVFLPGARAGL